MKHTIVIDLPDGLEPQSEAKYISADSGGFVLLYLKTRPAWQCPEWLTAEWIVQRQNDWRWIGSIQEPKRSSDALSGWIYYGDLIDLSLTRFTPPPCTDWRQSKRRNPRATK